MGGEQVSRLRDEDDQILQFAIQQSLIEAGSENDQVRGDYAVFRCFNIIPLA